MSDKIFELRDKHTFIPILAVRLDQGEPENNVGATFARYLLARAGFGGDPDRQKKYVVLTNLEYPERGCHFDPLEWSDRTYQTAHQYIIAHWDELKMGDVIDVEFILGETESPKQSEMFG